MKFLAITTVTIVSVLLSATALGTTTPQGKINMLEVWQNGNAAFTLSPPASTCNGMFILNKSDPGMKSQLAVIVTAKASGRPVQVQSNGCVAAENYGESFNSVNYLYLLD